MSNSQLLLVCADPVELRLLTLALQQANLQLTTTVSPSQVPPDVHPDLIVLASHEHDYLPIVRALRKRFAAPLILLGDYHRETDHIAALNQGVDLFLFRPYSIRFLAAQIPALLQRFSQPTPPEGETRLSAGQVRLDPETQTLQLGEEPPKRLSQLEFRLLHMLMLHPQQVISTAALIEYVWGYSGEGDSELVRKLVWRLRTKLKDNGREPCYIHTIPNVGYSFRHANELPHCPPALPPQSEIETRLRQVLRQV